mmetsp:Transcript_11442/g.23413  ORF Transcript_11442/g.23413 Transcript_11442/m.23413 type:complete len:156 (-) Transcript_11442:349-816(-)
MVPRSFEHRLYITMSRVGHSLAFLSKGLISYFTTRLDGISNCCALYSFTGILFTLFVGMMISKQPLYIKGIDANNQEMMKESAFGAMGMFIFLFSSSLIYLCYSSRHDNEHHIRSQGYMRPRAQRQRGIGDYLVELPDSHQSGDSDEHEQSTTLI